MGEVLKFLNQGWVGTTIGLVGILCAFVLYWRSRIGPILAFQYREIRLIGGGDAAFPDEVKVLFREVEVPRLTLTRVWLWNSGKKGVRGDEVVAKDPLRIELSGTLLKATVVRQTREVLGTRVVRQPGNDRAALVSFDFLDPRDGALIEVLHSGPRSGPSLKGTVRGLPKGVRDWGEGREGGTAYRTIQGANVAMFLAGLFFLLAGAGLLDSLGLDVILNSVDFLGLPWRILLIGFGIFYTGFSGYSLWKRCQRFPRSLAVDYSESNGAQDVPHNQTAGADG